MRLGSNSLVSGTSLKRKEKKNKKEGLIKNRSPPFQARV
jgi:hypothetical protein